MAENPELPEQEVIEDDPVEEEDEKPSKESAKEDDAPQVRQVPWKNREERAEFFKEKKKGKDDDEELTEVAETLISKRVKEQTEPIMNFLKAQSDEIEIKTYLLDNPEDKTLAKTAKKYMQAYPEVPVENIFAMLKGKGVKSAAPKVDKEAVEKAKSKNLGGSSARSTPSEGLIPTSQKEKEKLLERIKRGETIKLVEE